MFYVYTTKRINIMVVYGIGVVQPCLYDLENFYKKNYTQ